MPVKIDQWPERRVNVMRSIEVVAAYTKFTTQEAMNLPVWDFMEIMYEADRRATKAASEAKRKNN